MTAVTLLAPCISFSDADEVLNKVCSNANAHKMMIIQILWAEHAGTHSVAFASLHFVVSFAVFAVSPVTGVSLQFKCCFS